MSERTGGENGSILSTIQESRIIKLLGGFAVVIVLIAGIGAALFFLSSAAIADDAERDLQSSARADATALDTWASDSRNLARQISASRTMTSGNEDAIQSYTTELVEVERLTAGARAVHYIDATNSEILARTLEDRIGMRPGEEGAPWARRI
jgi:hypothetical protein